MCGGGGWKEGLGGGGSNREAMFFWDQKAAVWLLARVPAEYMEEEWGIRLCYFKRLLSLTGTLFPGLQCINTKRVFGIFLQFLELSYFLVLVRLNIQYFLSDTDCSSVLLPLARMN